MSFLSSVTSIISILREESFLLVGGFKRMSAHRAWEGLVRIQVVCDSSLFTCIEKAGARGSITVTDCFHQPEQKAP